MGFHIPDMLFAIDSSFVSTALNSLSLVRVQKVLHVTFILHALENDKSTHYPVKKLEGVL